MAFFTLRSFRNKQVMILGSTLKDAPSIVITLGLGMHGKEGHNQ